MGLEQQKLSETTEKTHEELMWDIFSSPSPLDNLNKAIENKTIPYILDRRISDELIIQVTKGSREAKTELLWYVLPALNTALQKYRFKGLGDQEILGIGLESVPGAFAEYIENHERQNDTYTLKNIVERNAERELDQNLSQSYDLKKSDIDMILLYFNSRKEFHKISGRKATYKDLNQLMELSEPNLQNLLTTDDRILTYRQTQDNLAKLTQIHKIFSSHSDQEEKENKSEKGFDRDSIPSEELAAEIDKLLEEISPKEAEILKKRLGILSTDARPVTLEVISRQIGVTRESVRQRERRGIRHFTHNAQGKKLKSFIEDKKAMSLDNPIVVKGEKQKPKKIPDKKTKYSQPPQVQEQEVKPSNAPPQVLPQYRRWETEEPFALPKFHPAPSDNVSVPPPPVPPSYRRETIYRNVWGGQDFRNYARNILVRRDTFLHPEGYPQIIKPEGELRGSLISLWTYAGRNVHLYSLLGFLKDRQTFSYSNYESSEHFDQYANLSVLRQDEILNGKIRYIMGVLQNGPAIRPPLKLGDFVLREGILHPGDLSFAQIRRFLTDPKKPLFTGLVTQESTTFIFRTNFTEKVEIVNPTEILASWSQNAKLKEMNEDVCGKFKLIMYKGKPNEHLRRVN